MAAASDEEIAATDFILSILPPGDAVALAQRFAPALKASNAKPVYVDCNAINPDDGRARRRRDRADRLPVRRCRHHRLAAEAGRCGAALLRVRAAAPRFATLTPYGLDVRVLDGPLSAASALKMSYAGITKGTQALGAAMMLAATRGGSADALFDGACRAARRRCWPGSSAQLRDDAAQGLSLGRGDARDRRLRRRGPARTSSTSARRISTSIRRGFRERHEGRNVGAGKIPRQKPVMMASPCYPLLGRESGHRFQANNARYAIKIAAHRREFRPGP